jgi:TnpA family transposase
MASIERTAYPRFDRTFSAKEIHTLFTPSDKELLFTRSVVKGERAILHLLLLMKSFQYLGYFPKVEDIPHSATTHLCAFLQITISQPLSSPRRSIYRYHQVILEFLEISAYNKQARRLAASSIYNAAQSMDNPADLINVAIETLIKERFELPSFYLLDKLARRIRTLVNYKFFAQIFSRLTPLDKQQLDTLFAVDPVKRKSAFNSIKEPPRSAKLSHMYTTFTKLKWLLSYQETVKLLEGIPYAKIKNFAIEAKSYHVDTIQEINEPKRYTLLICLIYKSQVTSRDNLIEMFLKRLQKINNLAKDELLLIQQKQREKIDALIGTFTDVLHAAADYESDASLGREVDQIVTIKGGADALLEDCQVVSAYTGKSHFPLMHKFYRHYRSILFKVLRLLNVQSTSQDQSVVEAVEFILDNQTTRARLLPEAVDLSFVNEQWEKTIMVRKGDLHYFDRRHLEVCVFHHIALELKTGDLYVDGSEEYADYRTQLLSWDECEPMVTDYCAERGIPERAVDFVAGLRAWLSEAALSADKAYPTNSSLIINEHGEPRLKRISGGEKNSEVEELKKEIEERLSERTMLDILRNVNEWTGYTRHFGPLSGSDPKIERAPERYIFNTFCYGSGMGAADTSRHSGRVITPHMILMINRSHVTAPKLDKSMTDILNVVETCELPKAWGTGKRVAADGDQLELYEDTLLSEYHIRYGGWGGVAYRHISDWYVALLSHFISCGAWEAIYILDLWFKNNSNIRPDTIHADTQGQNGPVFGLAYMCGIKLMPRIRHWKDLVFYRPDKTARYRHIDELFGEAIDWQLIETHWQDLLRVVLSIRAGKLLPSTLLRKLSNYSRKNKLYQAFRELGLVDRTVFLLKYVMDPQMQKQITAETNKVEAYHEFAEWCRFAGGRKIEAHDPEEQEKMIKYNDLLTNAIILHNIVDMTNVLREMIEEGKEIRKETVGGLSPYLRRHIRRFGDYVLDMEGEIEPLKVELKGLK